MTLQNEDTARVLGELVRWASPSTRRVRRSESRLAKSLDMSQSELSIHIEDLADFGLIEISHEEWSVLVTEAGFTERSGSVTERKSSISGATPPCDPKSSPSYARARGETPSPHYKDRATRPDDLNPVVPTCATDPSSKARSFRGDRAESAQSLPSDAQEMAPAIISLGRIQRGVPDPARNAKSLAVWFKAECASRARTPRFGDVNVGALSGTLARWRKEGLDLADVKVAMESFLTGPWERATTSAWKQLVSNINAHLPQHTGGWDDEEDWG